MAGKYKAVLIGAAHMHCLYLSRDIIACEGLEFCGFSDTEALTKEPVEPVPFTRKWNKQYITERLGVRYYDDWIAMLDEVRPDLAIVSTETCLHPLVFEACAERGIAVSMEKPMAVSYAEALKMARTAERTGTPLMVNWPMAWMPFMPIYKDIIESGRIGRIVKMHVIVGHPGPLGRGVRHPQVDETSDNTTPAQKASTWWHTRELGGGAMLDFCGYGAMACNYLAGQKAVMATGMRANTMSQFGDADDNGVIIVRYPEFMATLEGSWTVPVATQLPPGPTIYGTEGLVRVSGSGTGDDTVIEIVGYDGRIERVAAPAPRKELKNVQEAFVHHMDTGEPLPVFLDMYENLDVMAILDAGVNSAISGRVEPVQTRAWGNR